MPFQKKSLVIGFFNFKIGLWMKTSRAIQGWFSSFVKVTAVSAFPDNFSVPFENFAVLKVRKEGIVSFFVGLFHPGD